MRTAPLLVALVFGPMLVEARRARRNERLLRERGGVEPTGDVYALMRLMYPAAFLAMIAEGAWRSSTGDGWTVAGLALFVLAKALKWWAIGALGPSWTFRVIVRPGSPRVVTGPYAYLRHPNYVAVAGELVGVALLAGARLSGPLMTLAFGGLLIKRIAVEEHALRQAGHA